jgi:hypothetical protein
MLSDLLGLFDGAGQKKGNHLILAVSFFSVENVGAALVGESVRGADGDFPAVVKPLFPGEVQNGLVDASVDVGGKSDALFRIESLGGFQKPLVSFGYQFVHRVVDEKRRAVFLDDGRNQTDVSGQKIPD